MTVRKKMTLAEFNEEYSITITVLASQEAKLDTSFTFLDYDPVDTVHENLGYALYRKENHEEIFTVETDSDETFLEELYQRFEIEELEKNEDYLSLFN